MLRIPGGYNSKHGGKQEVKIIQRWDGNRPDIRLLLGNFHAYLIDDRDMPKPRTRMFWMNSERFPTQEIQQYDNKFCDCDLNGQSVVVAEVQNYSPASMRKEVSQFVHQNKHKTNKQQSDCGGSVIQKNDKYNTRSFRKY
jgi:hypothetical protein